MMTQERCEQLLALAHEAVAAAVEGRSAPVPTGTLAGMTEAAGAFVTLRLGGELRGCIGFVVADDPLPEVVAHVARLAALEDPRFPPVATSELPHIAVEISVLGPIHPVGNIDEITIGRDGLVIEAGHRRGLLLPQVAVEYGWTVREFLAHTCRKAGLPPDAWEREGTTIRAFSAETMHDEHATH
jgi:AmmeMemoRadiSam system protein A